MAVTVDLVGLLDRWAAKDGGMGDHCRVVFRDAVGPGEDADPLKAFTGAVEAANRRLEWIMLDDGGIATAAPLPVRTPSGPGCDTESRRKDALTVWLKTAADALQDASWSGSLEWLPFPPRVVPSTAPSEGGVAVVLALRGWETTTKARANAPWRNGTALAKPLARMASDWLQAGEGAFRLTMGMGDRASHKEVEPLFYEALADSEDRYGPSFWGRRTSERSARGAAFDALGHIVLAASGSLDTRATADELIASVTPWATGADWICLLEARVVATNFIALYKSLGRGRRLPRYYNNDRALDQERLPDAFGWQVVTGRHLTNSHDLSRWEVTEIDEDRFVLADRDLEPWFAVDPSRPDEPRMGTARLEAARRDFGDVILWDDPPRSPKPSR